MDTVDLALSREPGYSEDKAEKADVFDSFISLVSILTYIADISTDIFLAYQYYKAQQWNWFIPTVVFIVVPSMALQLFSSKWYHDDSGKQPTISKLMHLFQLGTIERYWYAFWYGSKTLCSSEIRSSDYVAYLSNWRDVTMLRFFECFFESAPQVVLQLYIISTFDRSITVKQDWEVLLSVGISLSSIAWSMVSYSHAFRLYYKGKGYGLCGYTCQILYRLFMISSRIAALVLFATEFSWIVIIIAFIHWLLMIAWLSYEGSAFCSSPNKIMESFWEKLFLMSVGFVYVFCFINIKEGTTRTRVMAYYVLFFVENSLLIAVWYATRTKFEILEIGAICIIWGGFLLGIIFMLLHYKFFHPNQDITEGWCTFFNCTGTPAEENNHHLSNPSLISNGHNLSNCNRPDAIQKPSPRLPKSLSVDVELSPQRDQFRRRTTTIRDKYVSRDNTVCDHDDKNVRNYGTVHQSPVSLQKHCSEVLIAVPNGKKNNHTLSYKVCVQKSQSCYDLTGTVTKIVV